MQQNDLSISSTAAAVIIRQDGTRCLGSDESSGWVWVAGRVLASQILSIIDVRKLRILELGSGTGWLALTLAQAGAVVTATERPGALHLLMRNVYGHLERNAKEKFDETSNLNDDNAAMLVEVEQCKWEDETRVPGEFDLIIGSDLLYIVESYVPLLNTLIRHNCKRCLLTWEERLSEEEASFLTLATEAGFAFEPPMQIATNKVTNNPIWYLDLRSLALS